MVDRIVSRAEWKARGQLRMDSRGNVTWMRLPADGLWLHHSVTGVTSDPYRDFRVVESVGIERFGYLSYSYLSHPDDVLGEGAGCSIGAHTEGRNSTTFALCLVGDYTDRPIADAQVEHCRWLYWYLRNNGLLKEGAFFNMHRAVAQTACPGNSVAAQFGEIARYVISTPHPPEEDDMTPHQARQLSEVWEALHLTGGIIPDHVWRRRQRFVLPGREHLGEVDNVPGVVLYTLLEDEHAGTAQVLAQGQEMKGALRDSLADVLASDRVVVDGMSHDEFADKVFDRLVERLTGS